MKFLDIEKINAILKDPSPHCGMPLSGSRTNIEQSFDSICKTAKKLTLTYLLTYLLGFSKMKNHCFLLESLLKRK